MSYQQEIVWATFYWRSCTRVYWTVQPSCQRMSSIRSRSSDCRAVSSVDMSIGLPYTNHIRYGCAEHKELQN